MYRSYSSGNASSSINPHGLALTDLNGDGKTDAVVAKAYWMGGMDVHYGTRADLELTLTSDKSTALVNERVHYTVTITNKGPDVSKDVKLEQILPIGMFPGAGIFRSQGTCDADKRTCNLGAMQAGKTATVKFEAYSYTDTGTLTNTVNLKAFNYTGLTKTTSLDIIVTSGADLSFTENNVNKSSLTDNIYYSAYVRNSGDIAAEGVVITDILPSSVTPVTAILERYSDHNNICLPDHGRKSRLRSR